MKNSSRMFILIEGVLAAALVLVAAAMLRERNGKAPERVAVILQDSEASQWSALRYGLRAAAEDLGIDVFVMNTEGSLTAREEQSLLEREIENGAAAVIVQPAPGNKTGEMLKRLGKRTPVMLVGGRAFGETGEGQFPVTAPDNFVMGSDLAEMLLEDCGGELGERTVGIVCEQPDSQAVQSRQEGFLDALEGKGSVIAWTASVQDGDEGLPGAQEAVDFVVALDDGSVTEAGRESAANDLHGALVYGIGNSTEAVYYLDLGDVQGLIVPDEFNVGYQSLTEIAKSAGNLFYTARSQTVSHTVLRRETIFLKENQEILFTMNQ